MTMLEAPLSLPGSHIVAAGSSNSTKVEIRRMIQRNHSMQDHHQGQTPKRGALQRQLSSSSATTFSNNNSNMMMMTTMKRPLRKKSISPPCSPSSSGDDGDLANLTTMPPPPPPRFIHSAEQRTRKRHLKSSSRSRPRGDDPLGGSLHSPLTDSYCRTHQPRRMLREDFIASSSATPTISNNKKGSPQRGGLLRQRSGNTRMSRHGKTATNGALSMSDDSDPNSPEITKAAAPPPPPPGMPLNMMTPTSQQYRKTPSRKGQENASSSIDCGDGAAWCCNPLSGSLFQNGRHRPHHLPHHNGGILRRKYYARSTWWQWAVFAIVGSGIWLHSRHRVHLAHKELAASHVEKTTILSQMEWLDGRAKQNLKSSDNTEAYYQRRIKSMEGHIKRLEKTLQDSSREQLERLLPGSVSSSATTNKGIKVEMMLQNAMKPIVLELWHKELPYTAWTWLDQVQKGVWTNSIFQQVDNSWIDIHPATSTTSDTTTNGEGADGPSALEPKISNLAFREEPLDVPTNRRFVLGMRFPQSLQQHQQQDLFVLTIHLEAGTCESDENEVCFGQLVDGFDELAALDMEHNHWVSSVKILQQREEEEQEEKQQQLQ